MINKDIATNLKDNYSLSRLTISERIDVLKRLYDEILFRSSEIEAALKSDFNKNQFDTYATEVGITLREIRFLIRNLKRYAKPKRIRTGIINFSSHGVIYPEPFGVVLVIAPWNYPFQLSMCPLAAAVAAGNFVCLKPSAKTKATFYIIKQIIEAVFTAGTAVVTDRRDVLDMRWDYIFFTGSPKMGRNVMRAASEFLTPVTLELGGKSPCIVDENADIKKAAKRIAWGKFINAGQTCIAPDHILVHKSVKESFVAEFIAEIKSQYYIDSDEGLKLSDGFAYIINQEKSDEVLKMLQSEKILFGGKAVKRQLEPTVIETNLAGPFMQDEIFAPVAPVIEFNDLTEVIARQKTLEKPLALYYFGNDFDKIKEELSFGGGCYNDVIMHVGEEKLPFGGVGNSGMGKYHGKASFDTFTHYKSLLIKGKAELKTRYAPHSEKTERLMKKFLK